MKAIFLSLSALGLFSSCTTLDSPMAQRDATAGAAIGGVAGAIIGHQSGETRNGALLGAALGGLTGYVIGEDKDRKWHRQSYQQPRSYHRNDSHR